MARETIDDFIDFDSPLLKRRMMTVVGTLRGMYEVVLKPRRVTRSQRANRFYFAAVVRPFFEFLKEQDPKISDRRQAHVTLKKEILGSIWVRIGGRAVEVIPTTHDMDVSEFMDYVEKARVWLAEKAGIVTLDPSEFGVSVNRETGEVEMSR